MEDEDSMVLKQWCSEKELDYELASKLKTKILPLLESAHNRLSYNFDKAITEQMKEIDIRFESFTTIMTLLEKMKNVTDLQVTPKEQSAIFLHLQYIVIVESLFSGMVDFVIFTLIANGHDLYVPWKQKYAKSFKDIASVRLLMRLEFLKEHGLGIISDKCDVNLRNSVAHLFYKIEDDGTTHVASKRVDVDSVYQNLRNIAHCLYLIIRLYYRRFSV